MAIPHLSTEQFNALTDVQLAEHINKFYSGLRPLHMDLLQDIGSTELIVLEGDALLLKTLADPLIDWTHHGAFLHLTFVVERFLMALSERGAAFRIVFFADHQALWAHSPSLALARLMLIEHLQRSTKFAVDILPSWRGEEFTAYLHQHVPACIICSDGEQDPHRPEVHMDPSRHPEAVLRAFSISCLSRRYHCVYSTDITARNNTLYGFVVRSQSKQFRVMNDGLRTISVFVDRMLGALLPPPPAGIEAQVATVNNLVASDAAPFGGAVGSWRAAALSVAAGAAVKTECGAGTAADIATGLAKAFIVHAVLLRHLPLQCRAQALAPSEFPPAATHAASFLAFVCAHVAEYVRAGLSADLTPAQVQPALCDIIDARLFFKVLTVLARPTFASAKSLDALGLSAAVNGELQAMWAVTAKAAGVKTALWPMLPAHAGAVAARRAHISPPLVPTEETTAAPAEPATPATEAAEEEEDEKEEEKADWEKDIGSDEDEEEVDEDEDDEEKEDDEDEDARLAATAPGPMTERDHALLPIHNDLVDAVLGTDRILPMMHRSAQPAADAKLVVREFKEQYPLAGRVAIRDPIADTEQVKQRPMDPDGISFLDAAEKALRSFPPGKRTKTIEEVIERMRSRGIKNLPDTFEKCITILRRDLETDIKAHRKKSRFVWHVTSKVVRPSRVVSGSQVLQQNVKYVAFLHKYAESLAGTEGLSQRAIVLTSSETTAEMARSAAERETEEKSKGKEKDDGKEAKGKKGGKKEKEPKLSKADQIRAENMKRRAAESADSATAQWKKIKSNLDGDSNLPRVLEALEKFIGGCDVPTILVQANLYKLKRAFALWDDVCVRRRIAERTSEDYQFAVRVFRLVFEIYATYGPDTAKPDNRVLTGEDIDKLAESLAALGLEEAAKGLKRPDKPAAKKPPARAEAPSARCHVGMSFARFQLTHMGHLLEHEKPSVASDARVRGFVPDDWQRNLMDVVDRNESALVCAPTSSGKTFISFYAMEKVLRGSHDGVIVYVAPTRALVNQVCADVYARFGQKTYPATFAGTSVFGIYLGGYQYKPLRCQVLVTDPAAFDTLLLSSDKGVEAWRMRIKYAIYDEIHCLNKDGSIWERIILMSRCPFVALSATIGNPEQFRDWLQEWQDRQREQAEEHKRRRLRGAEDLERPYRVHLVIHSIRFSDLQKWVYCPSAPLMSDASLTISAKAASADPNDLVLKTAWPKTDPNPGAFQLMHPCVALDADKIVQEENVFTDLTFMPQDTLALWDRMWAERASEAPALVEGLEPLDPDKYFATVTALTRPQARVWDASVKALFTRWVREGPFEVIERILRSFAAPVEEVVEQRAAAWYQASRVDTDTPEFLRDNTLGLLMTLQAQQRLPALFFNFEQEECERIAITVIQALQAGERVKREATAALRKKNEKKLEKARKEADKNRDKKVKKKSEMDGIMDGDDIDIPVVEGITDPDFSFVTEKEALESKALEEILRPLSNPDIYDQVLIDGLRRGIGVHHSGLKNKYRQAVERLFRHGHLRVVVATHTLALGIHMPCRSVVFAGDSVYLDALQFRQMSGRAGRRGYDPLGHVVFFGVPLQKIKRLMSARIPDLRGRYPLSSSLVLRLLQLHATARTGLGSPQRAIDTAIFLFERPLVTLTRGADCSRQIKHHMSFALEFLQSAGVISALGKPVGTAAVASYLSYAEPSNLAFVTLLRRHVFEVVIREEEAEPHAPEEMAEKVMEALFNVLAHLFGREPLHVSATRDQLLVGAPCKVALAPLSPSVEAACKEYNAEALTMLTRYARAAGRRAEAENGPDTVLPASKVDFGGRAESAQGPLFASIAEEALHFEARSPFAAVSGHGDSFSSIDALTDSVREGVYVDPGTVPTLDMGRSGQCLSAYALDFLHTKSKEEVSLYSGLSATQVWHRLNDFIGIIEDIRTALDELRGEADDRVCDVVGTIADTLRSLFGKSLSQ